MLWVDTDAYVGPDRRRARGRRLLDRRRFNATCEAPSLAVMLRQLHLRVLELELGSDSALERYIERLEGVIAIAEERGQADIAATLRSLHRRLSGLLGGHSARGKISETINRHLAGAMAMLVR